MVVQPGMSFKALTIPMLARMGGDNAKVWAPLLRDVCAANGIDNDLRQSLFIATILTETSGLRHLVESFNYAATALPKVFGAMRISPFQARSLGRPAGSIVPVSQEKQQMIANIVYGGAWGLRNLGNTQPNDGWFFRGAGLIQLTGRANHTRFALMLGVPLVDLPALLSTPKGAADSAATFWRLRGCNQVADKNAIKTIRAMVNGGSNGLDDFTLNAAKVLSVLQD
jgi:putative chitinase